MVINYLKRKIKRILGLDIGLTKNYLPKDVTSIIIDFFKHTSKENLVIVCIGSNRTNIVDFLGPFVGSILKEDRNFDVPVYGSMINPINALNLTERITEIKNNHPASKIIAIDACLSEEDKIGSIIIKEEPLIPGSGINNKCPEVGDISIKGIVGPAFVDLLEYYADIKFISAMAYSIAEGLKEIFIDIKTNPKELDLNSLF